MPSEPPARVRTWRQIICRRPFPAGARGERGPVAPAAHPSLGQQSSSGAGVPVLPVGPVGIWQRLSLPLRRRHGSFHSQRLLCPVRPALTPGQQKETLSHLTLESKVSRLFALSLKAIPTAGSLHLACTWPSSQIPLVSPASPLSSSSPSFLSPFQSYIQLCHKIDRIPTAQNRRFFSPAVGGLTSY